MINVSQSLSVHKLDVISNYDINNINIQDDILYSYDVNIKSDVIIQTLKVVNTLSYDRVITVSSDISSAYYMQLCKYYRDQAEYYASISMTGMGDGERKTGIHAGVLKEMSITDDYVYICVVGGDVGVAVWKKFILFQT
jgi:hypothetical protein